MEREEEGKEGGTGRLQEKEEGGGGQNGKVKEGKKKKHKGWRGNTVE